MGILPRPPDCLPRPTEVLPRSNELVPRPTDVRPRGTNWCRGPMEVLPRPNGLFAAIPRKSCPDPSGFLHLRRRLPRVQKASNSLNSLHFLDKKVCQITISVIFGIPVRVKTSPTRETLFCKRLRRVLHLRRRAPKIAKIAECCLSRKKPPHHLLFWGFSWTRPR